LSQIIEYFRFKQHNSLYHCLEHKTKTLGKVKHVHIIDTLPKKETDKAQSDRSVRRSLRCQTPKNLNEHQASKRFIRLELDFLFGQNKFCPINSLFIQLCAYFLANRHELGLH